MLRFIPEESFCHDIHSLETLRDEYVGNLWTALCSIQTKGIPWLHDERNKINNIHDLISLMK